MKKRYLITAVLLILSILFAAMPVSAATINEKASALTSIGVLKGSIEGQLKRSEASTFVVRLLGKESVVDAYTSNFPDVAPTAWYAPYVGYCTYEGILTGQPDGKFHPDDYTSEKAFIKMVLVCLGYTYGEDFDWSNVYKTAYMAGIVKDASYASKTADNNKYMRADVVELLYNAMTAVNIKTNVKMVQQLINDKAITLNQAIAAGFINDPVQTAIVSVTATNANLLSVKFNEQIKALSDTDIVIYRKDDAQMLTGKLTSQIPGEIIISTGNQIADEDYIIEINNIYDKDGNRTGSLTGTFTGYRPAELKSDYFRISKAVPVSKNIVNVYFTHPITSNSEIPSYYEILKDDVVIASGSAKDMTVKRLASTNNAVSILLKDIIFAEGEKYSLRIKGDFTSLYTVKLNDGLGESITFKGVAIDNSKLDVQSITPLNSTNIEVVFSKEVDPAFAQKFVNYSVTDQNNVNIAVTKAVLINEGPNAGKSVKLTLMSSLDMNKKYEMRFEYIPDVYRESALEAYSRSFDGLYSTYKTDLKIEFATALDKGTVQVYLDKALNPTTAVMNVYYMVLGNNTSYVVSPVKVSYEEADGEYRLKLYLPNDKPLAASGQYKVRILNAMQDINGNTSSNNAEYVFDGTNTDVAKPAISEATIISKDTLKVKFNRDLAYETPNILTRNYSLIYSADGVSLSKEPVSVIPIDNTTYVLKFDSLQYDIKYKLSFGSLKDITGTFSGTNTADNVIDVVNGK